MSENVGMNELEGKGYDKKEEIFTQIFITERVLVSLNRSAWYKVNICSIPCNQNYINIYFPYWKNGLYQFTLYFQVWKKNGSHILM